MTVYPVFPEREHRLSEDPVSRVQTDGISAAVEFTPQRFGPLVRTGNRFTGATGEKQGVGRLVVMTTLVTDRIGTLSRMAALLGRLGMDIISVTVSPTPEADVKRITLAVEGPQDEDRLEREFLSLADILEVRALPEAKRVDRELMLVKTATDRGALPEALTAMGARALWQKDGVVIAEVTGEPDVLSALIGASALPFPVYEAVVTGYVSLWAGSEVLKEPEHTGWSAPEGASMAPSSFGPNDPNGPSRSITTGEPGEPGEGPDRIEDAESWVAAPALGD